MTVILDPGHGPGNKNGNGNGYLEHVGMWTLAGFLAGALAAAGVSVVLTRTGATDPALPERGEKARGADVFLSLHSNAANGTARGVECYYSVYRPSDKTLAATLAKKSAEMMGNPDRGPKIRTGTDGADYYGVIRSAVATGCPHVFLLECGFHDNPQDCSFLNNADKLRVLAEAHAVVLRNFACGETRLPSAAEPPALDKTPRPCSAGSLLDALNVPKNAPQAGTPILGAPTATAAQLAQWAQARGAAGFFVALAETFFAVATKAGVDPAVVYCQSAKETAFGKFGGVLDASYHNPCGLKTTAGGGDKDPAAHTRFACWEDGISAQVDHLALYAGAPGYPRPGTLDPRHFPQIAGTANTVEALSGKWAPSASYGADIVGMMKAAAATVPTETPLEAAIRKLTAVGVISSPAYWLENADKLQHLETLLIKTAARF